MGFYKKNIKTEVNQEGIVSDLIARIKDNLRDVKTKCNSLTEIVNSISIINKNGIQNAINNNLSKYAFGSISIPNGYLELINNLHIALENADNNRDLFTNIKDVNIPAEIKNDLLKEIDRVYKDEYEYRIIGAIGTDNPTGVILPKPKETLSSKGILNSIAKDFYHRVKLVKLKTPISTNKIKLDLNTAKKLVKDYGDMGTKIEELIKKYRNLVFFIPNNGTYIYTKNGISTDATSVLEYALNTYYNYVKAYVAACSEASGNINQEALISDTFKDTFKNTPGKTNKVIPLKDIDLDTLDQEVFGYLALFKGKLISFKYFIDRYKETITNLSKMVSNIDKYGKMDKEDVYKLVLHNISHISSEFNLYTPGEKGFSSIVRSDEENGIYLKTYAMYPVIKASDKYNRSDLTIDFATFGYDTTEDNEGIYGFMEESDDWVTEIANINLSITDRKKYLNNISGIIDLNKLYSTIGDAYEFYKKIDAKKPRTYQKDTLEYKVQNVILDVYDRVIRAYHDLLEGIMSVYIKLSESTYTVSTEDIDNQVVEDDSASDIDAVEATTAEIEFENTVEDSEELDELADRVDESLEKVEESLENPEEVEAIDVAVVNESLNHYFKAIGLPRENIGISTEAIKQNPVANLEAIKVELEGLGSKIKEYATAAWKKIVELFKKLVEYLTDIFNRTKFRIKRLLTTKLEIPNKEIEFTDNERLIFTFGADWLEATIGEVCNHVATVTLESLKSVIKVPRDDDSMDKLHSIKDKEFNALNKDFMIGGNISTLRLRLDAMAKGTYNDTLVKNSKLVYMYPANAGYDEITVNLLYVQPAQYKVIETIKLQAGIEDINKLFPKVESTYKDPKFLENLLKKMQSFEEPRKQFLQEIASVGIGVTQELDKLKDDKSDTANAFWETFNGFKTNLQIVLNLANGYGKITDVLLKYIERNFASKQ